MAIGSSVYQPTTVSYEPRPGSLLSQTTAVSPLQILRKPISQVILLVSSVLCIVLGECCDFFYFFFSLDESIKCQILLIDRSFLIQNVCCRHHTDRQRQG